MPAVKNNSVRLMKCRVVDSKNAIYLASFKFQLNFINEKSNLFLILIITNRQISGRFVGRFSINPYNNNNIKSIKRFQMIMLHEKYHIDENHELLFDQ